MGTFSTKTYFQIMQKYKKECKEKIYFNKFNKEYVLKRNKFIPVKKKNKFKDEDIEEILNWKRYLLTQLETNNKKSWKYYIYNYIEEKEYYYQYFFKNEIFIYELAIFNEPNSLIKMDKNSNISTILSPMDSDDLDNYSKSSKENKSIRKIKKEKEKEKNIKINDINNEISSTMDSDIRTFTISTENRKQNPAQEDKYKSDQIKRYINFILNQLKNKHYIHPISDIIINFNKIYDKKLKKEYLNDSENQSINWNEIKVKVIKDIQEFIEIMQVALKLFYFKSINYKFFTSERDEFINLICYFLFNSEKNKIYDSVFKIFQKSNEEKQNELENKLEKFDDLKPIEAGIHRKFCLDEDTEDFIKNEMNIDKKEEEKVMKKTETIKTIKINDISSEKDKDKNSKKPEIVKYLEEKDKINEKIIFDEDNMDKIDIEEQILNKYSFDIDRKEYKKKLKNIKKADKVQQIININNNIEEKTSRTNSIANYQEFSSMYNSLSNKESQDLLNKTMDNLPHSTILDYEEEKANYDLSKPYAKAINYMKNIKKYKGPLDKLVIIALISTIIKDSVDGFWQKKIIENLKSDFLNVDADNLMGIYLYIVYNLNQNFDNIFSELDFIENFTTPVTRQSMIGYYFTVVKGCLEFILSAKSKKDFILINKN